MNDGRIRVKDIDFIDWKNRDHVRVLFEYKHILFGVIRVEQWYEGLILWVGGEIRWKSWNDK
jgi:hypothetical protein